MTTKRRGRPPLDWLTPEQLAELPGGTAICLETYGRHSARTIGRITTSTADALHLVAEAPIPWLRVRRGRVIARLFEPGDPVLRRGIPATNWRGGVVETQGTDVLVEQIGGAFAWFPEAELVSADTPQPPSPAREPQMSPG